MNAPRALGRRGLILAGIAAPLFPPRASRAGALTVPPGNRLGFDVMRRGARLGEHVLTFRPSGETLDVTVHVEVAYSVGPNTLYRYRHDAQLRWQGDRVVAIDSRTDDNGAKDWMNARRGRQGWWCRARGCRATPRPAMPSRRRISTAPSCPPPGSTPRPAG